MQQIEISGHNNQGKSDARHVVTKSTNLQVPTEGDGIKSLVRSGLEYVSVVWNPHLKKDIDNLEKIQRRAARYTVSDYQRTSSVTANVTSLGWDTLQQRRQQARMCMMHKILHDDVDIDKAAYFTPTSRHPNVKSRRNDTVGIPMLKENGQEIKSSKDKAQVLGRQYESVFTNDTCRQQGCTTISSNRSHICVHTRS